MSGHSRSDQGSPVDRAGIVVDVWSDIVCPSCYLGETALALALEDFP